MYELKKNGKVFTSKFVGTGPSSYGKSIYRPAVPQRLRNTGLDLTAKNSNFCVSRQSAWHTHVDFKKRLRETCGKWYSVLYTALIAVCFDTCLIFSFLISVEVMCETHGA